MKRLGMIIGIVLALLVSVNALTVTAQGSLVYVTDFDYASIQTGGQNDTLLYTAYDDSGFVMGTLDTNGELTRTAYSLTEWRALFEEERFSMTVTGNAAAQCPYAHTHAENTVCPYFEVICVTLTDRQTGALLENYYIESDETVLLPDGAIHFCFGRYGYQAPVTLKWDGESAYMALQNQDGLWGVYDIDAAQMVTAYAYADMSAIYGTYAKVSDGTAWGRLDVEGKRQTAYIYDDETAFSVTEEIRQTGDNTWQVFSKDNEAVSAVFEATKEWTSVSYASGPHLVLVTEADGTKTLYDLRGDAVASFTASQTVTYLQDACYVVGNMNADGTLAGAALVRVDDTLQPTYTAVKGDVNGDGAIDSTDVRWILCGASDVCQLTALQQAAADMDDDGQVTSMDARALLLAVTQ